jgi:hypothetical protein
MGEWNQAAFFGYPKIITGMVLVVMRVDHDRRAQLVAEFQESFPSVNESGVD